MSTTTTLLCLPPQKRKEHLRALDLVEGLLLCLLCCNVVIGQKVVFGKEAAKENVLLQAQKPCPKGLTAELQKELRRMLLPSAPTLALAFATVSICIAGPPLMVLCKPKNVSPDIFGRLFRALLLGGAVKHIINFCLLHISFLYFVLSSYIVARIAESHVTRVEMGLEAIEKQLTNRKREQGGKEDGTAALAQAHHECVELAYHILPDLGEKAGKPILGFAVLTVVYAFVWMLLGRMMNLPSDTPSPLALRL